jgi:NitT/TauT family transport system ATP-binding protein
MNQPLVDIRHLNVTFPNGNGGLQALDDISFQVAAQEFVCVLGPSGSGKTTLLRVLAGLLQPTGGEIQFTASNLVGGKPHIGLVFQQANLMPWRTVLENILLPIEIQQVPAEDARRQAQAIIQRMGLEGFEQSWPGDLSGGMAQRVAIARSFIQDPDLLLMDEPFGSLDALTRDRMGAELLDLWQERRKTVIMVTHSISEALLLADRVIVLTPRPGRICLDLEVDLPRPRTDETRYEAHFSDLARKLKSAIH